MKSLNAKFLLAGFIFFFVGCQSSVKNDQQDAWQKIPDGVEESEYERRLPIGGEVTEARIGPPFWWVNMPYDELQLLIYAQLYPLMYAAV